MLKLGLHSVNLTGTLDSPKTTIASIPQYLTAEQLHVLIGISQIVSKEFKS